MSKAVGKIALGVGLVALAFVPGVGQLAAGLAFSAMGAVGATSVIALAAIQSGAALLLFTTGLSVAAGGFQQSRAGAAPSAAQTQRLNASLVPSTPRIIAFGGSTATTSDLRASA